MDFVGPLQETPRGHDTTLEFVDRLTEYVHCVPTHSTVSGFECARLSVTHVLANHGMPKTVVSDRGVQSNNQFWKHLMRALGTQHVMSTAYHPQTDGQTERTNRALAEVIRTFARGGVRRDRDLAHPFLMSNAQHRQCKYAYRHRRPKHSKEGDLVMLHAGHFTFAQIGNRKLMPKYLKPLRILGTRGTNVVLELPDHGNWQRIHNVVNVEDVVIVFVIVITNQDSTSSRLLPGSHITSAQILTMHGSHRRLYTIKKEYMN
jgi:hypothetical protein